MINFMVSIPISKRIGSGFCLHIAVFFWCFYFFNNIFFIYNSITFSSSDVLRIIIWANWSTSKWFPIDGASQVTEWIFEFFIGASRSCTILIPKTRKAWRIFSLSALWYQIIWLCFHRAGIAWLLSNFIESATCLGRILLQLFALFIRLSTL